MRRIVVVLMMLALLVSACSSSGSDGQTTDTGVPESLDRCEETDPRVLDYLRGGLIVDADIPWGFTVRSGDYPDVWIVAAAIDAPDVLNELAYGTWAIRADVWPTSYIGAVAQDEIAMLVSSFGDEADIIVVESTDGVRSAQDCAAARIDATG